jgi:hypothetical protein
MKPVLFSLFGVGLLAVVVLSWLSRREDSKVPGFGDLAAFVMAYKVGKMPIGRVAVLGFWWWAGWHFFAR